MDVNSITAICAVIVAAASLVITVIEGRTQRIHNRQSVRPVLQIDRIMHDGNTRAGLKLRNVGLGPAVITSTSVTRNGRTIGPWSRDTFSSLVGKNKPVPSFSSLYVNSVIPAGSERHIAFIDHFKEKKHFWFWKIIAHQITLEVSYESIYGGENFTTVKHPRLPAKGDLIP